MSTKAEDDNITYRVLVMGFLSTQLWLEVMDEIKNTKLYKHEVKQLMNKVEAKLEKLLGPHFSEVYARDEKDFTVYMESLTDMMEWTATAKFEDVVDLSKALKNGQIRFEDQNELQNRRG
jgi:transcriptional regulator with GAF, ATPase, and Fis domain